MTDGLPFHIHISEREADGTWEDCTWDAGLEWYRDCIDPAKPATHAEAQLLRAASGEPPTGGSNLGNFRDGVRERYGKGLPPAISNKGTVAALTPGKAGLVQGSMSAFGSTHRLSKYDRNFDGSHAVYIANVGGVLLWCDPEAPTSADVPVVVTPAEVQKFVNAFAGESIIAPLLTKEAPVANLTTYLPGYTAIVKTGSNVRAEPRISATKLWQADRNVEVPIVGTVEGDVDPANGSNVWYEFFLHGRSEYTAKDNITNLTAPAVVEADCSAVEAELAAKTAIVNEQATTIAGLKTDLVAAKAHLTATYAAIDGLKK